MSKKIKIKELLQTTNQSYSEIGKKLKCSKQYVSQIAKEFGLGRYERKQLTNQLQAIHPKSNILKLTMNERLYQPDFSCIFGKKYSNAFLYAQVDSLVWPIFLDIKTSENLKRLTRLENNDKEKYFYSRSISINDEKVELYCSNINIALIQAMELGREYGITNSDVINAVKKSPETFRGILSYDLSNSSNQTDILLDLKNSEKEISIVGVSIYPSYTELDLSNKNNTLIKELLSYCKKKDYFIKIDIGNLFIPENYPEYTSPEKIKTFLSHHPDNIFILSGLDITSDFNSLYSLLKYFNNLWIEIDPRSFGGMTPTDCFKQLFHNKGFIQNCWNRLMIGSATPSLEISQTMRGFLEATEILPASQKCILRTWAFRNINRLNQKAFIPFDKSDLNLFNKIIKIEEIQNTENSNEINITYKLLLRSYSITQLLYLTDIINDLLEKTLKAYPYLSNGELFMRTYHTTTTLIINEHEHGNYLDLHYKFAELSMQDNSDFLHTVMAMEKRADFNHYDHELASTYGSRQIIIPIINRSLEKGGRENFYILVTFGPRTFQILIKFKLYK